MCFCQPPIGCVPPPSVPHCSSSSHLHIGADGAAGSNLCSNWRTPAAPGSKHIHTRRTLLGQVVRSCDIRSCSMHGWNLRRYFCFQAASHACTAGSGRFGMLGTGNESDSYVPALVQGGQDFVIAATGAEHSCAVTSAGAAFCWGNGKSGRLGIGNDSVVSRPAPVVVSSTISRWASVSGGFDFTCGLDIEGHAYCFGNGWFGQLGTGSAVTSPTPLPVAGSHVFQAVAAGFDHCCGLANDGTAWCWCAVSVSGACLLLLNA